jgi:hypothetical protein
MPEVRARGLVIVRCGRNSLHAAWREGAAASAWDLQLSPYQAGEADWPPVRPGHKWDGLHGHLLADPSWKTYDYIWLPDDDLDTTAESIAALFEACRRFDAQLAQPALTENSYWALAITMRNRAFAARATTYVEVMAPCFRRDVLERMLPTFTESFMGAGWGLDFLWSKRLRRQGLYIFDDLAMRHTRPLGQQYDPRLRDNAFREARKLMARHEVRPILRTLRGFDADGTAHEADNGPFLLRYLGGYDYLVEQRPELLLRLIKAQTVRPKTLRAPWRRLTQNLRWPIRRRRRTADPSA